MDQPIKALWDKDKYNATVLWAADCAAHALSIFEQKYPRDQRPRQAIAAARAWSHGRISVGEARAAALAAHAAAREAKDEAARAAARAAGHAAATAHMTAHAIHAAAYALKAVGLAMGEAAVDKEREWQSKRLVKLSKSKS